MPGFSPGGVTNDRVLGDPSPGLEMEPAVPEMPLCSICGDATSLAGLVIQGTGEISCSCITSSSISTSLLRIKEMGKAAAGEAMPNMLLNMFGSWER